MKKRLQITLPHGWADCSEENEGGPTYLRELSADPGPLQVSWAEYTGGKVPDPSADDLAEMSRDLGADQDFGELIECAGGACDFGRLGTAIFRSQEQRVQIWHLSNGKDFITATHIGPRDPDPEELREVQEIVRTLNLAEGKSKWRFW